MNVTYKESVWTIDTEQAVKDLEQLEIGEECFYPESDYGHGFIVKTEEGFACFEIPMYGGEPNLENVFQKAEDAFTELQSWT
jgi:hypothetical protein